MTLTLAMSSAALLLNAVCPPKSSITALISCCLVSLKLSADSRSVQSLPTLALQSGVLIDCLHCRVEF